MVTPLNTLIETFILEQRAEQRLSKVTLAAYRAALRRFARTLPADLTACDLTPQYLRRFFLEYNGTHNHGSAYQMMAALRSFCGYLVQEGYLQGDPTVGLPLPKKQPSRPHLLAETEVQNLFAACDRMEKEPYRLRAKAVLSVFIFAGLRRQELLDLRLSDVELRESKITVRHGKGDKFRVVYIPKSCTDALWAWLKVRPVEAPHDYLFTANNRFRLGAGALKRMFSQLWAIAGYPDQPGVRCHALRHAYATRLLRAGADLASIQGTLGHSHLQTTVLYLHTDEDRLKEVAQLAEFGAQALLPSPPSGPGVLPGPQRSRRIALRRSA